MSNSSPASAHKPRRARADGRRPWKVFLGVLLVLALPVLLYSAISYRNREAFLEQRNYRALGALASHVSGRIDNIAEILQWSPCTCSGDVCTVERTDQCRRCTAEDIEPGVTTALGLVSGLAPAWGGSVCKRRSDGSAVHGPEGCATPLDASQARWLRVREAGASPPIDFQVRAAHWCRLPRGRGPSCSLGADDEQHWVRARATLSDILVLSLEGDLKFDDLLIVDEAPRAREAGAEEGAEASDERDGAPERLLFGMTSTSAVAADFSRWTVEEGGKRRPLHEVPQAPSVAVHIAGDEYRVYRQALPVSWFDEKTGRPVEWMLYGLVKDRGLRAQALHIPVSYGAPLVLLVIVGLLGWPLLKVWLVGPFDRFRLADAYALLWGTPLLLGIVLLFALSLDTYRRLENRARAELVELADAMKSELSAELLAAAEVARRIGPESAGYVTSSVLLSPTEPGAAPSSWTARSTQDARSVAPDSNEQAARALRAEHIQALSRALASLRCAERPSTAPQLTARRTDVRPSPERLSAASASLAPRAAGLPPVSLTSVIAVDADGAQVGKTTAQAASDPLARYQDRDYFLRALAIDEPCTELVVEPVLSRTRGTPTTVVAVRATGVAEQDGPAPPADGAPCPEPPLAHPPKPRAALYLASFEPRSVTAPVLPLGTEFLVIDAAGNVKYRSHAGGSIKENAFEEASPSASLRAAVLSGRAQPLDVTLRGVDYYAHVSPLEVPAEHGWSLLVYREQALLAKTVTQLLAMGTLCFAFLGLVYAATFVLHALLGRGRSSWLWYDPRRAPSYARAALALTLLLVGVGLPLRASVGSVDLAVQSAAAFGLGCLGVVYVLLELGHARRLERRLVQLVLAAGAVALVVLLARRPSFLLVTVPALLALGGSMARTERAPQRTSASRFERRAWLPQALYAAVGVLLLLGSGVVPAMAIHRGLERYQLENLARLTQRDFAERWWQHRERMASIPTLSPEQKQRLERAIGQGRDAPGLAAAGVYVSRAALCQLGFVPTGADEGSSPERVVRALEPSAARGLLAACAPAASAGEAYARATPWLDWIAELLPGKSPAAIRLSGARQSVGEELRGTGSDVKLSFARERAAGRLELVTRPAALLGERSGPHRLVLALALLGFAASTVALVLLVGARVYGARREAAARVSLGRHEHREPSSERQQHAEPSSERHRVVLDPLGRTPPPPSLFVVDARSKAQVRAALEQPSLWRAGLAVVHVEGCLPHAQGRLELLELLERATYERPPDGLERAPVWLGSEVDPMLFLREQEREQWAGERERSEEISRFARVLAGFGFSEAPPSEPSEPAAERDGGAREGPDRAAYLPAQHQALWACCSPVERSVLIHFAEDGFVNPGAWDVAERLRRRGLLRWAPPYELAKERFDAFLSSAALRHEVAEREKLAHSLWQSVRLPLVLLVVTVAALLALREPDLFMTQAGALTALLGGVAAAARLIDSLRNRGDSGET